MDEDFQKEVAKMVRSILNEEGKSHLTMGEDTLIEVCNHVEQELHGLFKRSDLIATLCHEDDIKPGHVELANHTVNVLHNAGMGNSSTTSYENNGSEREDNELKRARDRKEAVDRERGQYRHRLLENHRRRVEDNAIFIQKIMSQ